MSMIFLILKMMIVTVCDQSNLDHYKKTQNVNLKIVFFCSIYEKSFYKTEPVPHHVTGLILNDASYMHMSPQQFLKN